MATWDEERLKVENEVMGAMVDFLRANGIPYKSDIGYLEFPRPMVPEDKFKKIVEKAEAKLKELGYENYNVFETTIIVDFPEQIKWYKATFSSRTGGTQMWKQAGSGEEHEWYVYLPANLLVLSGYATSLEAQQEATRVEREPGQHVMVLPRSDARIREYARTHPAWARREGLASTSSGQVEVYPEVREGDVGTLVESITAEDTAGRSRRIPAGMEVRVSTVRVAWIDFITGEVIEGENIFTAPTLEFRRKFRKGAVPMGGTYGQKIYWRDIPEGASVDLIGREYYYKGRLVFWHGQEAAEAQHMLEGMRGQVAPSTVCPVCGDTVAGGPDEYLGHIKTKHPEEWRRLETDPSYTLRRAEAGPRQLVPIVRQLPTVTIRGKKYYLDAHLREYRAVDDPHDRIPLEPEYAKLLGEASVGSVAWNAVVESIIEEKQREAEQAGTGILRCRWCGAPYAYKENLELHERSCPKRGE